MSYETREDNEPAWAPSLRVLFGLAGMLEAYARLADKGTPICGNSLLRLRRHLLDAAWVMHYTLTDDVDSDRRGVSP